MEPKDLEQHEVFYEELQPSDLYADSDATGAEDLLPVDYQETGGMSAEQVAELARELRQQESNPSLPDDQTSLF